MTLKKGCGKLILTVFACQSSASAHDLGCKGSEYLFIHFSQGDQALLNSKTLEL